MQSCPIVSLKTFQGTLPEILYGFPLEIFLGTLLGASPKCIKRSILKLDNGFPCLPKFLLGNLEELYRKILQGLLHKFIFALIMYIFKHLLRNPCRNIVKLFSKSFSQGLLWKFFKNFHKYFSIYSRIFWDINLKIALENSKQIFLEVPLLVSPTIFTCINQEALLWIYSNLSSGFFFSEFHFSRLSQKLSA